MSLSDFIQKVKAGETVAFNDAMTVIANHYHYLPTEFKNGLEDSTLTNLPGSNEGSCKLFAFAQLHQLDQAQTLSLFGDYYRDVLATPEGNDHKNIRNFIKYGWQGIVFKGPALTAK